MAKIDGGSRKPAQIGSFELDRVGSGRCGTGDFRDIRKSPIVTPARASPPPVGRSPFRHVCSTKQPHPRKFSCILASPSSNRTNPQPNPPAPPKTRPKPTRFSLWSSQQRAVAPLCILATFVQRNNPTLVSSLVSSPHYPLTRSNL